MCKPEPGFTPHSGHVINVAEKRTGLDITRFRFQFQLNHPVAVAQLLHL